MHNILNFFHSSHTPFLHAHGELGSECMLSFLNLQGHERILDYGCGTGATLTKINSRWEFCELYGYDNNEIAIRKSKNRMRFCGISNKVVLIRNMEELHSKQGTFDVIYTESVLTILRRKELKESLFQIRNLLKPGGRLVCNETIWVDDIPVSEKLRINQICEDNFGIAQCSTIFSDVQNAISILKENGFYLINVINLDNFRTRAPKRNFIEYRSTCFSWLGKLMSYFSRSMQHDRTRMKKINKDLFSKKKYLSGQLIEVRTAKN